MLHHAQQLTHRPYTWHKRALHADQLSRLVQLMHGAAHVYAHSALVYELVQPFVGLGLNMLDLAVIKTQGSGPQRPPYSPIPAVLAALKTCTPTQPFTDQAVPCVFETPPGCEL